MVRDYPRQPPLAVIQQAAYDSLCHLGRVGRTILRHAASDYFLLDADSGDDDHDEKP